MSKIVWNINQFNGEQDTPYLWPAGCFSSSLGVDIRKEPPFIQLSAKMEELWTFDDNITLIKNLWDFWLDGILVCLDNGKVYLDWVLKTTISTGTANFDEIIGVWYIADVSWTDRLYYVSNLSFNTGKIHRSNDDLSSFDVSYKEFNTWGNGLLNDSVSILSESDRILIGVRDRVFELDSLEDITTKIQLNKWEEIVKLTEFQNQYRIYSSILSGSTFVSWKQYNWDWLNVTINYNINWNNLPLQDVVNDWAYDYAITGQSQFYSDLYRITWSQKSPIRVNLEWSTWKRNFNNKISARSDMLYISGKNKEDSDCIYSVGNYYPWFPVSLVWEYYTDWNNRFLWHAHTESTSYFACTDDKVYSVTHSNDFVNNDYVSTAYITTKRWVWNGIHTLKSIDYMWVWYKLESGTNIEIYASDWDGTYNKLLKTISDTTKKWVRIEANEFASVDLWDFYELELKVILTTTNPSNTPKIWPMLVFCNDNYNA